MPETGSSIEELMKKVDLILDNHIPHIKSRLRLLEAESLLLSRPDALISSSCMIGGFGLFILSYLSSAWQFAFLGTLLIVSCLIHLTTLKHPKREK